MRPTLLLILALTSACAGTPSGHPDSDVADAAVLDDAADDTSPPDSNTVSPEPTRDTLVQTSGGTTARTRSYQLVVRVGAPQPMGSAATSTNRVEVGPVAQR